MSNLDYPISILIREGGRISAVIKFVAEKKTERARKLSEVTRAISILSDVKREDEKKEFNKRIDKKYKS